MAQSTTDSNIASRHRTLIQALVLFFFLVSVYLLTYNGLFRSIAELSMFSLTESLVQEGSWATPQLIFSRIHNPIGAFEFLQPILSLPLYFLAYQQTGVGNIQTVMLFNILVTAVTAVIIWLILREMGYSPGLRLGGALLFGLATIAWPYARTFLREPLVGFFYVLAFLAFLLYHRSGRWFWAGFCLAAVIISLTVKLTSLLVLPAFALAIYFASPRDMRRRLLRAGAWALLIGGTIFGLVIWQRWGADWLNYLLRPIVAGGTIADSLMRIWGLTFSPGKGLFLYSPVLLLGIWGGMALRDKRRIEVATIMGIVLFYLLAYSRRKGWFGGLDWGPRYLVPLAPLLIIPAMEIFTANGWRRWVAGALVVVSLPIQLLAATANYSIYYQDLVQVYPKPEVTVLLDPRNFGLSPVVGQIQIWNPQNFDLLWWRASAPDQPAVVNGPILFVLVGLLVLAAGFLLYSHKDRPWPEARLALLGMVAAFGLGVPIFLSQAYQVEANYWYTDTAALREAAQEIDARPALVVSVANDFHHLWLKNYLKGDFLHYWFSPLEPDGFEVLRWPMAGARDIALVTDSIHPNSENSHLERWLNQEAFRYHAQWIGPYVLFEYAPPATLAREMETDYRFGEGIALLNFRQEEAVERGEVLRLELHFQKVGRIDGDYTLFTHLLSAEGVFVAGTDGEPQFGAAPTSLWGDGEGVVDRRGILIPGDIPPGEYQIEVGFYRDGQRLEVNTFNGEAADSVIIGQVVVE